MNYLSQRYLFVFIILLRSCLLHRAGVTIYPLVTFPADFGSLGMVIAYSLYQAALAIVFLSWVKLKPQQIVNVTF